MSTPKTNRGGAKEVATPQTKETANANNAAVKAETPKAEPPKAEERPAPVVVEMNTAQAPARTLDEQIQYFLGLERLVNIRRRLEHHLEAVSELEIPEEDLTKFEAAKNSNVSIILYDGNRRQYEINNPRLVKEMRDHLAHLLETKISDYNTQILTYDQN